MTEAAIGSALTTIVFLFALSRLREPGRANDEATRPGPGTRRGEEQPHG